VNINSWGSRRYGEPKYADAIRRELLDIKPDGSFWLNPDYFNFLRGTTMTNEAFYRLFGRPPRRPEEKIDQRHMDVARSIQLVTEEIMLLLARHARELTGLKNLCMAGGVALNCVANGRILRRKSSSASGFNPRRGCGRRAGRGAGRLACGGGNPALFPPPQMPCKPHCSDRDILTARSKRCCARTMRDFKNLRLASFWIYR